MRAKLLAVFVGCLVAVPVSLMAQDEGAQSAYAYVTYFECNPAIEFRADEIITRSFKPHYDAAVEAGDILSWAWLSHFVGGKWRRVLFLTAANTEDLLSAAGALGEAIEASTPEAGRVFTEVCPVHEDYIWETSPDVGGSNVDQERGTAAFSIYMDCDINREERADEIMRDVLGPVYDRQVASGGLTTWTWLRHNVGGQWRRLLSLTATDHNTMMNARAEIIDELSSGRTERFFNQLNEICPDHQDYMWDIQQQTP